MILLGAPADFPDLQGRSVHFSQLVEQRPRRLDCYGCSLTWLNVSGSCGKWGCFVPLCGVRHRLLKHRGTIEDSKLSHLIFPGFRGCRELSKAAGTGLLDSTSLKSEMQEAIPIMAG